MIHPSAGGLMENTISTFCCGNILYFLGYYLGRKTGIFCAAFCTSQSGFDLLHPVHGWPTVLAKQLIVTKY